MPKIEKLRESLLVAYGIIRQQTEQICDLHMLIVPLIDATAPKYARLPLGVAYLQAQAAKMDDLVRSKTDSLALVDEAIRRLREI
jgi:hypothetical protein